MKIFKRVFTFMTIFFLGIAFSYAIYNNFIKTGKNSDTLNYSGNANDIFIINGRLDLEDSRTNRYLNGYRGKITGNILSDLYGKFNIINKLNLQFDSKNPDNSKCGNKVSLELYKISGSIWSDFWGEMEIIENESYFCSNQYTYIKLKSITLGYKEIGAGNQINLVDSFGKQEIYIAGIAKIKGDTGEEILARGDQNINKLKVSISTKSILNKNIDKNITTLFKTYKNFIKSDISLNNLNNTSNKEKYYLYNLSSANSNINFQSTGDYINKGGILTIGNNGNSIINIIGKNTVIVKSGNIYINSNLTNYDTIGNDNNKNLLILVAKKSSNGKGGNIYIDPDVTNIDAVLIADGSLISLSGNNIQSVEDSNQLKNLRKQLLIYGSVLSSNVVGTNKIPYGADYYENNNYLNNEMIGNIYDLGNLRTFNLNYGSGILDEEKLVPIADNNGNYKQNAWAGQCKWYNGEECNNNLRQTTKRNPLIVDYNKNLPLFNSFILRSE